MSGRNWALAPAASAPSAGLFKERQRLRPGRKAPLMDNLLLRSLLATPQMKLRVTSSQNWPLRIYFLRAIGPTAAADPVVAADGDTSDICHSKTKDLPYQHPRQGRF